MDKEGKALQRVISDLRLAKKFWVPVLRQSWDKTWAAWLWIFVVPLAVNFVWAILFGFQNGWGELKSQIGTSLLLWLLSFLIVLVCIYVYFVKTTSAALYLEQKKISDRFNWNDINVIYQDVLGGMGDEEFKGYRLKIENNKLESFYFQVELTYLEIDGQRIDYLDPDKSRRLLWVSDDENNRTFGFALQSREKDEKNCTGLWELSDIALDNDDSGILHRIIFCDYLASDKVKPQKRYIDFTRYAKGELKILGKFVQPSGLSSLDRKWSAQEIPEDCVYKFEIDVIDGMPSMKIFEAGIFEYHA